MKPKYCIILLFIQFATSYIQGQNLLLFNGETSTINSCTFHYGGVDSLNMWAGNYGFEGIPDQWHSPGIDLGCQNAWRADLSKYDELWLYAKASQPGKTINIGFYGWPYVSNSLDLNNYGNALDTLYNLYKIPLDSMRNANYNLSTVEILYFGASMPGDTHRIYIDEIWAMDTKETRVDTIKIISETVIRADIEHRYDTSQVKTLANYLLQSISDSNYFSAQSAIEIGLHYYVQGFENVTTQAVPQIKKELFIEFPHALKNGLTYTLEIQNIRDLAGNDFTVPYQQSFTYNDENEITGTVKVNHIGYQPNALKYGYVGNYLGSSGSIILRADSFEIRDSATHAVIFTGTPNYRGKDDRLSGEEVYSCDFSALTAEGSYYLYVPGAGRSYDFSIDDRVYNNAFYTAARGLYYQRHNAVSAPYAETDFARGGAPDLCEIDISHSSSAAWNAVSDHAIGTQLNISGGWFDAGDYGRYVPTAAVALEIILTAYELFPNRFTDNFLNIPESGNGIPDLLDEAKIELDWLLQMQAPDGGVYFKVTTAAYAGSMPPQDTAIRYVAEKTTFSTGQFAAVMAAAYRVYHQFDSAFADTCLNRAKAAWQFLENHPTEIPVGGFTNNGNGGGGEYGDPGGDADERAWAAAELYKTTGDSTYHNAFEYYWLQHSPDWGWNEFQHHQQRASRTYCTIKDFPVDSNHVNSYLNLLELGIDNYHMVRADSNKYRNSYRSDVIPWIGWGSFAQSTKYTWIFIIGYHLLGKPEYLDYARLNFDSQLGNNPMNRSYITGLGYDDPTDPTHAPSQFDSIAKPVPGLPVFGPHSHIPMSNSFYYAAQQKENLYPSGEQDMDPYPTLRRYYDCHQLVHMSEFTIDYQALAAVCFARFCTYDTVMVNNNSISNENELSIKLYPIPATDEIILESLGAKNDQCLVKISNMVGQVLLNKSWPAESNKMHINTTQFPTGTYVCSIERAEETTIKKFIIQPQD